MEEREQKRVQQEWEYEHRKTQKEEAEIAQLDAQIEALKQRLQIVASSDIVQAKIGDVG